MKDLKIERVLTTEDGVTILRLIGAIDAHTFDEVDITIQDLFAEGVYKIVLNLEDVTYISSAGIGTLVSSTLQARENGGNLIVIKISNRLRDVLTVLGLLDALQCAEDLKPALARF